MSEQTTIDAAEFDISKRRRAVLWAVTKAGQTFAKAREYRVQFAIPALVGAALVSAAAAMRFGIWAGLAVAGAFCLRLDSRMR